MEGDIEITSEIKLQVKLVLRSKNILKRHKGVFSIFDTSSQKEEQKTYESYYFNSFSKKTLTFKVSEEKIKETLNIFKEILTLSISNNFDSIEAKIQESISLITIMDKELLITDEFNEEEGEGIDIFTEINKINHSNENLKSLKLNNIVSKEELNKIVNFCSRKYSSMENIELKFDEIINLKQLFNNTKLSSINFDFSTVDFSQDKEKTNEFLLNLKDLNNLQKVKISFPKNEWSYSISLNDLNYMLLSTTLTCIEISGFISNFNLLLEIPKIRNLKSFKLQDLLINPNDRSCQNTKNYWDNFRFLNLVHNNKEFINKLLANFSYCPNLSSFSFINCGLENIPYLNKNLQNIDFNNNWITNDYFSSLINQLKELKNPYTINLSQNYLSEGCLSDLKGFLLNNSKCKEINLTKNDFIEENTLNIIKYNLLQTNEIETLNLSGSKISSTFSHFIEIIKNTKKISSLICQESFEEEGKLYILSTAFSDLQINSIIYLDISGNKLKTEIKANSLLGNLSRSKFLQVVKINSVLDIKEVKKGNLKLTNFFYSESIIDFSFNNNYYGGHCFNISNESKRSNLENLSIVNTKIKCSNPGKIKLNLKSFSVTSIFLYLN